MPFFISVWRAKREIYTVIEPNGIETFYLLELHWVSYLLCWLGSTLIATPNFRELVMPRFGPEPKFEPEPGRTGPRSGSKVQHSGWTGPMVRFEVQRMAGFCRTGLNPSEPNLNVPKISSNTIFDQITCDLVDQFLVSCVWLEYSDTGSHRLFPANPIWHGEC
jgi:hypothetical protein